MTRIQPVGSMNSKAAAEATALESNSSGAGAADDASSTDDHSNMTAKRKLISIKFCIISIVLIAVISSVIIQTVIWILSFSISLQQMSDSIVSLKQEKLITHIDQTFNQFVIASQTAKYQIANSFTNISDINSIEPYIASFTTSESLYHKSIMKELSITNYEQQGLGYAFHTPLVKTVYHPVTGISVYICMAFPKCTVPYVFLPPTVDTTSPLIKKFGGKPFYTALSEIQQRRYVSLVNAKENATRPGGFDWYLKMTIFTGDLPNFLRNITHGQDAGSFGLIVETSSKIVVATSYPDTFNTTIPVHLMDDNSRNLYYWINESYPNFQLPCNTFLDVSNTFFKVSVYRYCTTTNLDWTFAVAIPRWTFIGNMVIAIIVGLTSGLLIILAGTILGVYSSIRISRPFWNLIELFDSLSRMELSNLIIHPSRFKEISQLQLGFSEMVSKIRQYRAFIPSHLLRQIESSNGGGENGGAGGGKDACRGSIDDKSSSALSMTMSALKGKYGVFASTDMSFKSRKSNVQNPSMFKLGMDHRDVSACLIYLDGVGDWFTNLDNNEVVKLMSEFFVTLHQISSKSGAHMGNFENQSVVLTWNSVYEDSQHTQKSLIFSHQLFDRLQQLKKKWKTSSTLFNKDSELIDNFHFRIAVHSQSTKCGNVGTKESKVFTIMSSLSQNLQRMVKHSIKMNVLFVVSEPVHAYTQPFLSRFVGRKQILIDDSCSLISKRKGKKMQLYEVGELIDSTMDEWMYELSEKERKKRWINYNQAFSFYLQQVQLEEALNLMKEFKTNFPSDLPAQYLYKKIKKLVESSGKQ